MEAGKRRTFEVVVPLVTAHGRAYGSLSAMVQGYGVANGNASYAAHSRYSGHSHTPFVLMSSTLGTAVWSQLQEEMQGRSQELSGCLFDVSPAWVPSDWRAFTGVASLWLSDADWDRIPAGARTSLLQWVAQGGLVFYCTSGNPVTRMTQAGLPGTGRNRGHGLGRIIGFTADEEDLSVTKVADAIKREAEEPSLDLLNGYTSGWPLEHAVGEMKVNAPLLILAVIVFAVVVGPINLLVFAGPRRRHRLFITTPLLSLGSALFMGGAHPGRRRHRGRGTARGARPVAAGAAGGGAGAGADVVDRRPALPGVPPGR